MQYISRICKKCGVRTQLRISDEEEKAIKEMEKEIAKEFCEECGAPKIKWKKNVKNEP